MLDDFTLRTFQPLVGSTFRVAVGNARIELRLSSATGQGPNENPFTLTFTGPSSSYLPQGTYTLEHDVLGSFDVFVSPTSRTAETFTTDAVFNRWPPPAPVRPG